jgi:AraC-like DNA-binding protein
LALTAALASTRLDLGPGVQVIRITGSGLALIREPRQLQAAAPERIVLSLREPDGLSLTDGTTASEAFRPGIAGTKLLLIDYDRLSLPVDLVHRAVPQLRTSPVYPLVRAHVALLCEGDGEPGPEKDMLRVATIELVRALITSAARDRSGQREPHDTLYLRVSEYLELHLTEPGLNAESVARAHHVSVRTLYNAWSAVSEVPLRQSIIAARLAGARAQLSEGTQAMTIAAVARRWGFADATHFARRFRDAYGLSPREWRQLHLVRAETRR